MMVHLKYTKPKHIPIDININNIYCSVINPKTGIVEQHFKGHSHVINFMYYWQLLCGGLVAASASKNINDGNSTMTTPPNRLGVAGTTSSNQRGLLVGDSDTPVSVDQLAYSRISDTRLTYFPTAVSSPVIVSLNESYIEFQRTVTALEDNIEIKDMAYCSKDDTGVPWLMARDVLPTPITLNTDDSRVFRYRIYTNKFFIAWIQRMYAGLILTNQTLVDTGGVNRTLGVTFADRFNAPSGNATYGIVIGSGDEAVDIDQYSLETQHTTTDFTHSTVEQIHTDVDLVENVAWTGVQRTFTNISGSDKTIREIGLYWFHANGSRLFMAHRHVLNEPVVLLDTEPFVVTYRFIIQS
jgi:hypothetical protein